MTELKPCPFCKAVAADVKTHTEMAAEHVYVWRQVICTCGARGPKAKGDEAAIDAWNRRAGEGQK